MAPETSPGASPANVKFADCCAPAGPISTETPSRGDGVNGGVLDTVVTLPVTPRGFVCPSPVRYTDTMSPLVAGIVGELKLLLLFRIAPGPLPEEFAVNSPGAVVATFTWMAFELWPRNLTSTSALTKPAIS